MIFPGQFHEIAAVSKKVEAQPPVKVDGTLDVLYDNLSYQLLCGVNVSAHSNDETSLPREVYCMWPVSWRLMSSMSTCAQRSASLPSTNRQRSCTSKRNFRPVAGIPKNSPF